MRGGECQIDGGDSLTGGGGAELNGHPAKLCITRLEAEITVHWVSPSSPGPDVRCRRGCVPRAEVRACIRTFCVSWDIFIIRGFLYLPGIVRADIVGLRGAGSFEIAREFCCCISR